MTGERLKALVYACTGIEEDMEWTCDFHEIDQARWFAIHTQSGREFVVHRQAGGVWIRPVKFTLYPPVPASTNSHHHLWDLQEDPGGGEQT